MTGPRPLWPVRQAIAGRLERARRLEVAADFDGTLAPIVARPERAVVVAGARRALLRLARLPGARVAVISGRRLADLERRTRLRGAFLAGLSGLETREPGGGRRLHLGHGRKLPPALIAELRRWCARFPGAWLEHKTWSVAVHYRAMPARLAGAFGAGVRGRVRAHPRAATLLPGKKVYEVRPRGAPDKAATLAAWLGSRRRSPALFFLGDDCSDEAALALTRRRGGIAVAVGRRRSGADYRLGGPAEVTRFLEWLEARWRERARRGRPAGSAPRRGVSAASATR